MTSDIIPEDYNWTGKFILIAEDEVVNFRLLQVMLSRTNATIFHGRNGLETLKLYSENPQVDIILMDIKMPDMDGCEVAKEIRKHNTAIPIIAQTAYTNDDDRENILYSGCNCIIIKPILKRTLLSLIDSFFNPQKD